MIQAVLPVCLRFIEPQGNFVDISVNVEIIHSWISDLKVSLVTPEGTRVDLHNHEGADGDDIHGTYDSATLPALANLAGNEVQGNWSLVVVDIASQDVCGLLYARGLVIKVLGPFLPR